MLFRSRIVPNMVVAQNLATVRDEFVGTSDGTPRQTFKTRHTPLFAGSLVLVMDLPATPEGQAPPESEVWKLVEDFLASGGEDPHFTLNANTGDIGFGDGMHGRIPVAGAEFTAKQYRYGGGSAGNIAADLELNIQPKVQGVEKAELVRPAVGGRDEQATDDLKTQVPHALRSRNRAVTPEDFTALAQQAGGVAKAIALPLAHPSHPGVEVAGAVTVIIVPDTDAPNPSPSSDQIRSVCTYLNQYRLLTTELYVGTPTYKKIAVQALVEANPYAAFDAVSQGIQNEINRFLDPLGRNLNDLKAARTSGWGFGQPLHPTSLFAAILKVKDVVSVSKMKVFVDEMEWPDITDPVKLLPNGLFYGDSNGHQISVIPAGSQSGT